MVARVNSVQEYFETIRERFVPDAAKGVNATIQYDISGDGGGQWLFTVEDGAITDVKQGTVEKPTLTVTMTVENFLKVQNGDLDGRKAFMTRKMKVKGNLALAQKMGKFIPPGEG